MPWIMRARVPVRAMPPHAHGTVRSRSAVVVVTACTLAAGTIGFGDDFLSYSEMARRTRSFLVMKMKDVLIAAMGIGAAGLVLAQATPSFESLDKNSDGQISIQEATANDGLFVAFKQLDTNKDGALSKD